MRPWNFDLSDRTGDIKLHVWREIFPSSLTFSTIFHSRLMGPNGGTGVRELRRATTLPKGGSRSLLVVRDKDGRPQEDPLAVHCFCVCSGSALLGDLLGVSKNTSMERDLLSVLSVYPRIFLRVFIVCRRLVWFHFVLLCPAPNRWGHLQLVIFCYMFMCVSCFGLVVSTCQVIGYRKTPLMTPSWGEEIISTKLNGRKCLCVFFFCLVCLCCYMSPRPYTIYISYAYGTI